MIGPVVGIPIRLGMPHQEQGPHRGGSGEKTAGGRKRYDAGMPPFEAAQDIALDDYSSWGDGERIVVNVHSLYREFSGSTGPPDINALFAQMAALEKSRRK